ncbi:hypothetical protein F4804DRAFT_337389 [Jackrogersella minutella]|nr:hypothetical protein F4804DRAFT_337389 [Jackrogersella minutella]
MDFSGCPSDEAFGPTVQACRDDFDFTIVFEKIFFAFIPTAIFIALCPPRTVLLVRRPIIIAICIYDVLQLALLVSSVLESLRFKAFLVCSLALAFVSSICMVVVSHLEHSRSPRPSHLLDVYLLITILLDVA